MNCPKCESENVKVQIVSESQLKNKHHSILYWLVIGWWLHSLLWFFLTVPMTLLKLFGSKNKKLVTEHKSMAICQNCGYNWNV